MDGKARRLRRIFVDLSSVGAFTKSIDNVYCCPMQPVTFLIFNYYFRVFWLFFFYEKPHCNKCFVHGHAFFPEHQAALSLWSSGINK